MISETSAYELLGLNTENTLLQDTRLIMLCTSLALAIRSRNPVWAQSRGAQGDFEKVYGDYFSKICNICEDAHIIDNELTILNKAFNIIYMAIEEKQTNHLLYRNSVKAYRNNAIDYLREFVPEFKYADMLCEISEIANPNPYEQRSLAIDSGRIANKIHELGYIDEICGALDRVRESGIFKDTDFLNIAEWGIDKLMIKAY